MKKQIYINKITILILQLILLLTLAFSFIIKVNATSSNIEMVWTQVGEDSSTELIVSWHSSYNEATLYWTTYSDTSFNSAITIDTTGAYDDTSYKYDNISFYEFKVDMKDLIPNTQYRYKIKCKNVFSDVYTCKTAGNAGNFSFLWIGDYHTYKENVCQTRYTYLNTITSLLEKQNKDLSFTLSTGDNVSYGGSYDNYQVMNTKINVFKNTVFASVPGNHDNYGSINEYNGSSVNVDNRFFESVFKHPNNGIGEDIDSSYWFKYNSILFIGLDSLAAGYSGTLTKQKAWFEEVLKQNENNYQYLIVFEHFPWMNALTGAHSGPYTSNFNQWYAIFDKYNVDMALAGDHHVYYRSNYIYDNKVVSDESKGTVYVGCPQIGDRYRTITDHLDEEYHAIRIDNTASDANALANYSGCTYFTITPNGIKGELIDTKGNVKDSYFIKAKREINFKDVKDEIASCSGISSSTSGSNTYIDFLPSYCEYISNIVLYDDKNNIIKNIYPSKDNQYTITLNDLDKNKVYNYKFEISFVDGTNKKINYSFNTYEYFGSFNKFISNVNNDKIILSWKQVLTNNVISKYNIYKDNVLIDTIDANNNKYEINKKDTSFYTTYTIEAITNNGDIIFRKSTKYNKLGDANYDGNINVNDVTYLLNQIQASYNYNDLELEFLDLNDDKEIDIGDGTLIYEYIKGNIKILKEEQIFNVTVLNKDGNIAYIKKVAYGNDANLENISDTSFLYYSENGEYITNDVIIRPIYSN